MTLIISAICEDGVCVCADKRNKILTNGIVNFSDGFNKIYSFTTTPPLIIVNHGVNTFDGKTWEVLISNYKSSNRWKDMNLYQLKMDLKDFLEKDVETELKLNFIRGNSAYTTTGFVLCGKTSRNVNYKIYELFWSYDVKGLDLKDIHHSGFVRSGDGKEYLEGFLVKNPKLKKDRYWESLNISQAECELKRMFGIAVQEQKKLNEQTISDSFTILSAE